jgi:3-oxoacyl-[acyl-carrier protein] reductase
VKLEGVGAVVTGGSRGLGRAVAAAYVREGADVVVAAREAGPLAETVGALSADRRRPEQRIESVVADVARPGDVERLRDAARARLPVVTVVVNSAGVYGPLGRLEDVDLEAWAEAVTINLIGTVAVCRAFLPLLRARGYGKIITLSGGGATAPLPRFSAYAASKAAVVRFTETLAQELAGTRIDVNAVAPGALNTRLLDEVLAAGPERTGDEFYRRAVRQKADGGVPLERGAELAVFLASPASDGVTGRLLSAVWDDWAALPGRREALAATDVYTLRRIVPADRGLDWA